MTTTKGEARSAQLPDAMPTARSVELAVVALKAAAMACQSGASLRQRIGLDPLAREYLIAAQELERLGEESQ